MNKLKWNDVEKQSRTYLFPSPEGQKSTVTINNVVKVAISNTTHRLETTNGNKYIIPNGWIAIRIRAKEWSF